MLRPFSKEDLPAVEVWTGDPVVMRFQGGRGLGHEESLEWLERWIKVWKDKAPLGRRAVVLKSEKTVVGWAGLLPLRPLPARIEVQYGLAHSYWGQGLATEAGRALLAFGFRELELPEIVAAIEQQNTGSVGVAERLGMSCRESVEWPKYGQVPLYSIKQVEFTGSNV